MMNMNEIDPTAFIHASAVVEQGCSIGARSRIWAFAHILPSAVLGEDCNVCDHVFIENKVVVGNSVTIKCGVQLWDGVTLEDDVFVGPNVPFTSDPFPRAYHRRLDYEATRVQQYASLGANATILSGLTIGRRAMIDAGSVVTGDVPPAVLMVENPARIVRHLEGAELIGDRLGDSAESRPGEVCRRH